MAIQPGKARQFGVTVFASPDGSERTQIVYDADAQQLSVELDRSTLEKSIRYSLRIRMSSADSSMDPKRDVC